MQLPGNLWHARRAASAALTLWLAACTPMGQPAGAPSPAGACCTADVLVNGLRIAERHRAAGVTARRFTHEEFWTAVAPAVESGALRVQEVGASDMGRSIRTVTFGDGSITVLLWSQMHGDESTATMALADIFHFLAGAGSDPLRERLRRGLTLVFVPMLNPDGASLFQRENAAGIDINRDARRLATPEARTLKAVRDSLRPAFGFNLHDQNARTRAGAMGNQSAIALLAPAYDRSGGYNEVRSRARLVAATIARLLAHDIAGRVAKYDDSFNARAFGDLMQQWGTSTVLIESGALPDDPQKQRLRALNVAALLGALDAIATGSYRGADQRDYEGLPYNAGGAFDLLVVGGQLVLPGRGPIPADIAINFDDAVARQHGRIRDVGDLREVIALDTVDARGLFVHPAATALTRTEAGAMLRLGAAADLDLRRGADATSALVRRLVGGRDAP